MAPGSGRILFHRAPDEVAGGEHLPEAWVGRPPTPRLCPFCNAPRKERWFFVNGVRRDRFERVPVFPGAFAD